MTRDIHDERTLEEPVRPARPKRREQLTILVVSGPDAGRWFVVPREGGVIGRQSDVALPIADPAISRRHAVIEAQDDEYLIRDLGSRNGLYVQGRRIEAERLQEGDQIQVSTATVLRARYRSMDETNVLDEMHKAASSDPLTGMANRRYLMGRLQQELSFAWRHRVALSVLMIDLDHFKVVNDRLGHQLGDGVLQGIAELLNDTIRVEDVLARYGGDEFVVISRGYGPEQATQFGHRLCRATRKQPVEIGGHPVPITLSIGVAGCDETSFDEPQLEPMELLARADAALYRTKNNGRDGVSSWQRPAPARRTNDDWMRSTSADLPQVIDESE